MILTVTFNPAVDQTLQFEAEMESETVMRAAEARFDAGGKGINVAQFLTALDQSVTATGVLGGFTGQFIREQLAAESIETAFVDVDAPTRLNTTALAAGVEYKLNHDGPAVDGGTVEEVVAAVENVAPEVVVVGGSLPPGVSADAVDAVATAGEWDTVVDMGGSELQALDADYALCKPNREELGAATGADVSTVEGCARAANAFRAEGFDRVLASLGGEGAVLASDSGLLFAEAVETDVVDTVGAGDALLSGVVAAWADGADDATALRTGVAVATRLVEQAGTAVPDLSTLDTDRITVTELEHPDR